MNRAFAMACVLTAVLTMICLKADLNAYSWHPPVDLPPMDATDPGPDTVSRACLGCHTDDPGGTAPAPQHAYMKILVFKASSSHRIGFFYRQAIADMPLMDSQPELPLPNGKMACISCHDLDSGSDFLLADYYGNGSSALCQRCHAGY